RPRHDPPTGNYLQSAAFACDRSTRGAHGKEGVSGSSPEEGFWRIPYKMALRSCHEVRLVAALVGVWSMLWSSQDGKCSVEQPLRRLPASHPGVSDIGDYAVVTSASP